MKMNWMRWTFELVICKILWKNKILLFGMLGYLMNINVDGYSIILKSNKGFVLKKKSLQDITMDLKPKPMENKKVDNQNWWI